MKITSRSHRFGWTLVASLLTLLLLSPPVSAQAVVFNPHYSSVDIGENFAVRLLINTGGLEVKGLDLEVSFDSTYVELLTIEPGLWVTGYPLDWYFFDHTGEPNTLDTSLHFSLAFLDGSRHGVGELAIAHFQAKQVGATSLDWLTLDVRGLDNQPLVFSHSVDDSIRVEAGTAVAAWDVSRLKAQFLRR